jgi:hypothetical protein
MSRVRTNELTDAAGNNLSTAEQIRQGRAKAWFNLNGTGTIAERDSFNVSSYVDNGAGDYSTNLTTAFPNANYTNPGVSTLIFTAPAGGSKTTSQLRVNTINTSGFATDGAFVEASFFGD